MSSEALNQRFLYIPFRAFIISILFHLLFVGGFVAVRILDHFGIHLFENKRPPQIYQNFIQVDVVGLPTEMPNERKDVDTTLPIVDNAKTAAETTPEVKENTAPTEEELMAERKKKEDQKKKEDAKKLADEKKEREKALKKLQDEASREAALKALAKTREGKNGRSKIAGNILSKGTSMTGAIGSAKDRYQALVVQKIREHFHVYQWQRKKNLVAVVTIELLPNGRVRQKKMIKPSTDTLYNTAVLAAIDEAQPLPIPEDRSLISDGITIEFRPEE